MGIQGLLPFIEQKFPQAVGAFDINEIKGNRIAIDAHAWMYANRAIVQKKIIAVQSDLQPDRPAILNAWIKSCLDFCLRWLAHEITPVFCFDGPKGLIEKKETIEERKEERKKVRDEIESMRLQLESVDPLARDPALFAKYRSKLTYLILITREEINALRACLQTVGVVCLTAIADGEKLCSMLCREGLVRAVFSPDTDNIVYACPLLITSLIHTQEVEAKGKGKQARAVRSDLLLKELNAIGWSYECFIDLCIAAGCDYNHTMPGILIKTAFRLLEQHGSLDALATTGKYKIDCLNHIRCRQIFSVEKAIDLLDHESGVIPELNIKTLALQPLASEARGILDQYGLGEYSQIFSFVPRKLEITKPRLLLRTSTPSTQESPSLKDKQENIVAKPRLVVRATGL